MAYDVTLERRIRELCAQAIAARDTDKFQLIMSELQEALRSHTRQIKHMVDEYPFLAVNLQKVVPLTESIRKQKRNREKKKAV